MSQPKPGRGLMGWLGRQIGYVVAAAKADVTPETLVYRSEKTEEHPHPEDPAVVLRRTTIDEAVVRDRRQE
jgi:hypothetical protein